MKKLTDDEQAILDSYDMHNDKGVSTERLLQMVSDDCDCDVSDVIAAIRKART